MLKKSSLQATLHFIKEIKNQKIMRRSDVLKILFVCVCVCHVCPAHTCGDNPLMLVDNFSKLKGFTQEHVLGFMKERSPDDYNKLMSDFRAYLECTQMVHTGYFKRSGDSKEALDTIRPKRLEDVETQFNNEYGDTMKQLFDQRRQIGDMRDDNFYSIPKIIPETLENLDDLPFLIKRLLNNKIPISLLDRYRRLQEEDFMDV